MSVGPHIVGHVAAGGFTNNVGPPPALVRDEGFLPLLCVWSKRESGRERERGREKQIERKREREKERERARNGERDRNR